MNLKLKELVVIRIRSGRFLLLLFIRNKCFLVFLVVKCVVWDVVFLRKGRL